MNIAVLESMLKSRKFITLSVTSGLDAIDLFKTRIAEVVEGKYEAKMFKLILLDYSMPEMDGPQVATTIKNILEESSLNPNLYPFICCCTAYAEEAFRR